MYYKIKQVSVGVFVLGLRKFYLVITCQGASLVGSRYPTLQEATQSRGILLLCSFLQKKLFFSQHSAYDEGIGQSILEPSIYKFGFIP
jgi:hypothetical protein